ncbi:1-acyl-sn-glycerol-3-phosphate acyltransferase [Deinococcus sp.]|uniref:1-acyl-sn-glycerol-3-phosphate acyltransferase n=1 Tax=Deinococcus sp. TaxID=47478 RepID=UPI0025BD88E4|nr:1-acyl-sn-glycerol-3-phosphate acyltransferase [Deinococcus sp.]
MALILRDVFPTWKNLPHTPGSRAALVCLRLAGWTPVLEPPPGLKFVVAAGPHTANADFWVALFWIWATRTPMRWVGKHQLFSGPQGSFMRAVGGISLDRSKAKANFVGAVVELIHMQPEIALAVAPEGSRAYTPYWKTGFYCMAQEAGVPIGVMALDWGRKRIGITGYVQPTGDIEADFASIAALLGGVQGRYPKNQGPIAPRPVQPKSV